MMEIGSEFWKHPKQYIKDNEEVYLSGRTALDVIVKDAIKSYDITSALIPSYCCHTMIEPFIDNGVSVRFYDIFTDENGQLTADIPSPRNNEILYIMKYFGDTDLKYMGEGKALDGWTSSIEDLTHSCFNNQYETIADYWFTSYRKWFAIDGIAIAGKKEGELKPASRGVNGHYCQLRNRAFSLKAMFIDEQPIDKQKFLDVFSEAERLLSEDYRDYGARPDSVFDLCQFIDNIDQIKRKRRENANILLEGISNINEIRLFADFKNPEKCPLFVPILVDAEKRNHMRQYLINKDIYCPIHWPISSQHSGLSKTAKKIYTEELSLVCDQRYSSVDMTRVVDAITEFFEEC